MKNVKSDRDSFVGRLLAETLEAQGASLPDGSCLDAETLAAWADETSGRFAMRMFPGGHFFIDSARAAVLDVIAATLLG